MGSQEGYVFLYNQKSKTVEDYSDVFTTLTEGVQDMMMDKTGHLWISTNKRIIEYDPKTGGQINYQAGQDIVVNSFTKHSCFESQEIGGLLYLSLINAWLINRRKYELILWMLKWEMNHY